MEHTDGGSTAMKPTISFSVADFPDATALAGLHTAVGQDLTSRFGHGPWSSEKTERGVLASMRNSRVLVARRKGDIVGTLRLSLKKPWAIDISYFTPVKRAVYLTDMAVAPGEQRHGLGRKLIAEAVSAARAWPGDALRLDAFDAEAGAGAFYSKCKFREVGRAVYRADPLIYFEFLL
jgi:GNAT superfamily N-acetyltransferase